MKQKISIITVLKMGRLFKRLYQVFSNQSYSKAKELIIVYSKPSNDGTEKYIKNNSNIKIFKDEKYKNNGSLNIGIKKATENNDYCIQMIFIQIIILLPIS